MKKLSRLYIEITNICNLSCSFCIGNARPPRFMSVEEFEEILQQAAPLTEHLYLHVLGEPLLHPALDQILVAAHCAGKRVNLTTNGTLLAGQQELLLNAPALRKVSISLHSMEPGNGYTTEEYLRGVSSFALAAAEKGILCDLRLWNLGAEGTNNDTMFFQLCRLFQLDETKRYAVQARIRESGNSTLAPNLFLGTAVRFEWPSMSAPYTNQPIFCHALRSQAAVLCDGTVVPCCLDSKGDIPLGNLFETPLKQILINERARKLYDGFSARCPSEELCRRCGYATRF